MVKVLDILKEFMREVEKDNPFNLVLKGGTALSLYYLDHHRESEDLDFDAEKQFIKDYDKIREYLANILDILKEKRAINNYKITKAEFSSTNRYHINLELETYKKIHSKIDIDFVDLPENLMQKGELRLYSNERLFIGKVIAFIRRKEFKDIYDISFLIKKIEIKKFTKAEQIIKLLEELIKTLQKEDIKKMFRIAFKNVDLRFKDVKEHQLEDFCTKLIRELRTLINRMRKENKS